MELEINGQKADILDAVIALTRGAVNPDNLALKKIDFTNRFALPKSNVNRQIFGSPEIINSNNNQLDKLYNAKIIDQFFLFNGKGYLSEAGGKYGFQLIEASKEFFDDLNQNINQLDFESNDFTFGTTAYNALKKQTSSMWVWPAVAMHEQRIVDYMPYNTLKYSRPFFQFGIILNKIFTSRGWTLEYTEDIIDSLGLSSNHKAFYLTSWQKTMNISFYPGYIPFEYDVNDFEYNITTGAYNMDIGSISTAFRIRGSMTASADAKIIITGTTTGGDVTKEEFVITEGTDDYDLTSGKFETDEANNVITITITGGTIKFNNTLIYTIIDEEDLGDLSASPLNGYRVKVYDNLPNINQIDIFRDALTIINGIIVPDSFNKTIEIKSLKNLNKLNSVDWSLKFDAKSEVISPAPSGYGRINYLNYDNDESTGSKTGQSYFNIDNEIIKDEAEVIRMRYSASKDSQINGYTTASMYKYNDTGVIEDNEVGARILYIYEDSTKTYTIGRFLELHWNSLKSTYYQNYFDSFYRYREIEGLANLNKLDVLGFDFTQVVYIKHLNSYFIVLSIDNFIPNRKTKVKLLKFL